MFCKKCGTQVSDTAKFCLRCGEKIERKSTQDTRPVCSNCGTLANESARFCRICGAEIIRKQVPTVQTMQEAKPIQQSVQTMQKAEPVSVPVQITQEAQPVQPKQAAPVKKKEKKGFFGIFWSEISNLLKHPKKLIPTFILSVIWLALPLVTGFIVNANIPAVRFLCTLTYANGGIFGGYLGTVGGIFGKAVFAAVVNGFVLSLCAKQNPFKGIVKGMGGVFTGGLRAISPLLIGSGFGLILYWFFNITSAPQNAAVAIIAAIGGIQALGKQNGLLFGTLFYMLRGFSKGKAPSRVTISRVLTGMSTGFAIGFGITFLRYALLIGIAGGVLLIAGIVFLFVGRNSVKKAVAMATVFLMVGGMLLPFASIRAYAETPHGYWELTDIWENYVPDQIQSATIEMTTGNLYYEVSGEKENHVISQASDTGIMNTSLTYNTPKDVYQYGEEVTIELNVDSTKEGVVDFGPTISYCACLTREAPMFSNGEIGTISGRLMCDDNYNNEAGVFSEYGATSLSVSSTMDDLGYDFEYCGNKLYIVVAAAGSELPGSRAHKVGFVVAYEYTFVEAGTSGAGMEVVENNDIDVRNLDGYWEFSGTIEKKGRLSEDEGVYHISLDGGAGQYIYNFSVTSENITCQDCFWDDPGHVCTGEYVTKTLSASSPGSKYGAEEEVFIDLSGKADCSGTLCYSGNGKYGQVNISAYIKNGYFCDSEDDIFLVDTAMNNEDYLTSPSVGVNITQGGHVSPAPYDERITVSDTMPEGGKAGDKAYIVIIATDEDSLDSTPDPLMIGTAYEYTWVPAHAFIPGGQDTPVDEDNDIGVGGKPAFDGRLTYDNGGVNEYGQPIPDLMDFDGDGQIGSTDRVLQDYLTLNPDFFDTPVGTGLVTTAVLATVLGSGVGIGIAGGASTLSQLLSGLNLNLEADYDGDGVVSSEEKEYQKFAQHYDGYIHTDEAGDLTVSDPATGKQQLYTLNEDGTYRHFESGQSYTKDEIRNQIAYADRNKEYFEDIEKTRQEAVSEQREQHATTGERDIAEWEQLKKETEYRQGVYEKYGVVDGDTEELKRSVLQDRINIEGRQSTAWNQEADTMGRYEKGAELVQTGADISVDALAEIDTTGTGKVIKDFYVGGKAVSRNVGEYMAGNKTWDEALNSAAVEGSTEILKNHANTTGQKYAANIGGEAAKEFTNARMEGKSMEDSVAKGGMGAFVGLTNANIDKLFDDAGEAVNKKLGDAAGDVLGKFGGEEITKKGVADMTKSVADNLSKNAVAETMK